MSALEIAAVIVSALGVWLTIRRNPACWPVNLLAVVLYGRVFFEARLYSDTLLQGMFGLFALYGWWCWRRGLGGEGKISIDRLAWVAGLWGVGAGILGSLLLGFAMARYTDAAMPWLDATLTSFSLVGQFWAARKYIASWWLWIVVDVVYCGLYLSRELYLTAGLYAFFVYLAALGLRDWTRVWRAGREQAA